MAGTAPGQQVVAWPVSEVPVRAPCPLGLLLRRPFHHRPEDPNLKHADPQGRAQAAALVLTQNRPSGRPTALSLTLRAVY